MGTWGYLGHVRVYEYSESSWSQLGDDIDGEAQGDYSGISVSLSSDGTIVAIGAQGHDGFKGHVRVYEYSESSWSQLGVDIDGEAANDESGSSIALSSDGTIIAIGAYLNNGNGTSSGSGHVRAYKIDKSTNLNVDGNLVVSGNLNVDSNLVVSGSISKDVIATGGTITTYGTFKVHTFSSSGNFVVSSELIICDYLIVAGGGGGGSTTPGNNQSNYSAGGGGAGGLIYRENISFTQGTYIIGVGAGGSGGIAASNGAQTAGGDSSISSKDTAKGGGYGGDSNVAGDGGSGGGGPGPFNSSIGGEPIAFTGSPIEESGQGQNEIGVFGNRGGRWNGGGARKIRTRMNLLGEVRYILLKMVHLYIMLVEVQEVTQV